MIQDLLEERGKLIHEARAILDKANEEKRAMNDEERAKYDGLIGQAQDLKVRADDEARQLELDREAAARFDEGERARCNGPETDEEKREKARADAFRTFLRKGPDGLSPEQSQELRDLSQSVQTEGGYLVAPQTFVREFIAFVKDAVYIRQKATIFPLQGAQSLGAAALGADPSDADWTSELSTGTKDTALTLGKRELVPHPLAKRVLVSNKLIRNAPNAETLVRDRMGYKFGVTMEKAYLTGSGQNQPLGLFTASDQGISTSRDVSAGNTATSIQFDGLQAAKYGLKLQYRSARTSAWMFHRDGVKQVAQLKDDYGRYLWQPSVIVGQPDTLLGLPLIESEYVPNTFTSGKYVGILGDYSHYWIADNMQMQWQRLVELYAESNQIGFIGRLETDGMPVLDEAFVRVKLG